MAILFPRGSVFMTRIIRYTSNCARWLFGFRRSSLSTSISYATVPFTSMLRSYSSSSYLIIGSPSSSYILLVKRLISFSYPLRTLLLFKAASISSAFFLNSGSLLYFYSSRFSFPSYFLRSLIFISNDFIISSRPLLIS